jgi:DNA-binding transcriptional LysR family regulator
LVRMAPAAPIDINQEALFDDPLVVVAGANSPWTRRRKIELAELLNESWTWAAPGTLTDKLIIDAFQAAGLETPRVTIHSDAMSLRIKLIATGRFIAVVPASIVKFYNKSGFIKALPLKPLTARTPHGVITLKNRTLNPLAQRFIECARAVAKSLKKC